MKIKKESFPELLYNQEITYATWSGSTIILTVVEEHTIFIYEWDGIAPTYTRVYVHVRVETE